MHTRISTAKCLCTIILTLLVSGMPAKADGSAKGASVESSAGPDGTGQAVSNSNDSGTFMEEIVDPKEQAREIDALRKPVKLNRRALSPEELSNIGVQAEPSGRIIPLLNPNAESPIAPYGTQMSTYTEFPGVMPLPHGYPGGGPYGAPGYGMPGAGVPGFGAPGHGHYRIPYGAPYGVPYPQPGVNIGIGTPLNISGSSNATVSPAPGGGVTFGTSGTVTTGPTLQGGMRIHPSGAITGGAGIGLPTVTEYESSTTIRPILPQLPPPTAPDSN